jgi:hypothetical protein
MRTLSPLPGRSSWDAVRYLTESGIPLLGSSRWVMVRRACGAALADRGDTPIITRLLRWLDDQGTGADRQRALFTGTASAPAFVQALASAALSGCEPAAGARPVPHPKAVRHAALWHHTSNPRAARQDLSGQVTRHDDRLGRYEATGGTAASAGRTTPAVHRAGDDDLIRHELGQVHRQGQSCLMPPLPDPAGRARYPGVSRRGPVSRHACPPRSWARYRPRWMVPGRRASAGTGRPAAWRSP